jgi:CRP/FNR family cyclic AMP-dependent transcriptional regulator
MSAHRSFLSKSSSPEILLKGAAPLSRAGSTLVPFALSARIVHGLQILNVPRGQIIFSQGAVGDAVFYIQKGAVRLTVVSTGGKEAILALQGAGDFIGEECLLAPHARHKTTAAALTPCTLLRMGKAAMEKALHTEHAFSDFFVAFLLARNVRLEENLIDQLFNSSEKRLARVLLLLARFGGNGGPETVIPRTSQEMLAEMVGTTRSRVSLFMNRFRQLGYIDYHYGAVRVHASLLSVVLGGPDAAPISRPAAESDSHRLHLI